MALICLDGTKYPVLRTKCTAFSKRGTFFSCGYVRPTPYLVISPAQCIQILPHLRWTSQHCDVTASIHDFLPRLLDGTDLLP